ncbi:MAG: hypothetical protein JWN03_2209 [Nocardia sp.]|uniref:hypothetical protein n=1 Tax=Nocardia sp. TaxID=1821 RepID=UPI002636A3F5|nr:hypothetical protein [Nocardia sp.]MCU1641934.1 hypothetical protein [Nocardia sp.]
MIVIIALSVGIAIGAIGMAVMNRHPHSGGTAAGRDLNENAGGSRHIRTHPSWRDRLE